MTIIACGGTDAGRRAAVRWLADHGRIPCGDLHGDACEGVHDPAPAGWELWQQAKTEAAGDRPAVRRRYRELLVEHGLSPRKDV